MGEREGGQEENLSKSDKWGRTRWWFYSFQKRNVQTEPQTNRPCDLTRLVQWSEPGRSNPSWCRQPCDRGTLQSSKLKIWYRGTLFQGRIGGGRPSWPWEGLGKWQIHNQCLVVQDVIYRVFQGVSVYCYQYCSLIQWLCYNLRRCARTLQSSKHYILCQFPSSGVVQQLPSCDLFQSRVHVLGHIGILDSFC